MGSPYSPEDMWYTVAVEDFRRARRRALLEHLTSRFTGRSTELLPFEPVRKMLKARGSKALGLRTIPLDAIVGSVGRYSDFTRSFLPRHESGMERWARVKVAVEQEGRFAPIEVYQIGDAYFVLDGNHRVSIARKAGDTTIQAYVTQIDTRVPLSAHAEAEEVILMAEYAEFLERTRLDESRPAARLHVTAPGRYRHLETEIEAYRERKAKLHGAPLTVPEAAASWFDEVYTPAVDVIRAGKLLDEFPGRTETDLYVWLSHHRETLQQELGWDVAPESVVADLVEHYSNRPERIVARLSERLRDAITPEELEPGPAPGQWRRERLAARAESRLFLDTLVAISGEPGDWHALDQAILIAGREKGRLLGLHVEPSRGRADTMQSQVARSEFHRRCAAAGIPGEFVVDTGSTAITVSTRAWWADLVVTPLYDPPSSNPLERLRSRFRALIRRCPRPILAVPAAVSAMERALLSYDGSPRADEALYVAAYVAGCWGIPLTVITVPTENTSSSALDKARAYLERRGVTARYELGRAPIGDAILECATTHGCDFIIMGSYGYSAVRERLLGSTVDHLLRTFEHPILICR